MPLFTIIVPAYNRALLLPATLKSVLAQDFRDYELVVVDDGSTDDTAAVAAACGSPKVLRHERNQGPSAARNDGLAAARGEYCIFLDSDDLWAPWTLSTFSRAIRDYDRPAIVNCGGKIGIRDEVDTQGMLSEEKFSACRSPDYIAYRSRVMRELLLLTGMAIRTGLLRRIGGFRTEFRFWEDQDLWLRLGTGAGFVRIERPGCWGYREHACNLSKVFAYQLQGVRLLMEAERKGQYPGGAERRAERRKIVTATVRYVARQALRRGRISEGLGLYTRALGWNLRQGRWGFVLAYPAVATLAAAKEAVRHRGAPVAGSTG